MLVVVAMIGTWYGTNVYSALSSLNKEGSSSALAHNDAGKPPEWTGHERVNILLMGGDGRGLQNNQPARSDSMLVASIDPVTKKAHLFSILRDTYVQVKDMAAVESTL